MNKHDQASRVKRELALGLIPLVVTALAALLAKYVWAWTVVDLFPAAVKQGLLAERISWLSVLKAMLLCYLLASPYIAMRAFESVAKERSTA